MPNFFVNLYKPVGLSSFDCIRKLRKLLGIKKIGHMGTLDPFAEGVLIIGVNRFASFFQLFNELPKTYRATSLLGKSTDSGDLTGKLTATVNDIPQLSNTPGKSNVEDFIKDMKRMIQKEFIGEIEQVPPMASALKLNGKKLYEYHRKGIQVERKKRKCTIHSLELVTKTINKENPLFEFNVCCSSGTYIRTLTEDIFKKFNIPSHLTKLVRTSIGNLCIEDSTDLLKIDNENISNFKVFPEKVFSIGEFVVKKEFEKKIKNGNFIDLKNEIVSLKKNDDNIIFRGILEDGAIEGYYSLSDNMMKVMIKL